MSRPVSRSLKTASKPALKSPLRASTMPLLATSAVSHEAENPGRAAAAPAPEVTAQQLLRMQISEFSAWLRRRPTSTIARSRRNAAAEAAARAAARRCPVSALHIEEQV
jgi:hypothetical protein